MRWAFSKCISYVAARFCSKSHQLNSIALKTQHLWDITHLHHAQFCKCGSPSTLVFIVRTSLKLAEKLSTLLSTAQAEILGKATLFYHFPVLSLSRFCKSSFTSIFQFLKYQHSFFSVIVILIQFFLYTLISF